MQYHPTASRQLKQVLAVVSLSALLLQMVPIEKSKLKVNFSCAEGSQNVIL